LEKTLIEVCYAISYLQFAVNIPVKFKFVLVHSTSLDGGDKLSLLTNSSG